MSALIALPELVDRNQPAAPILDALLSEAERQDLHRLEATIDRGREVFVKVSRAYSTIRKGREEYQAVLRAMLEVHRKKLYREHGTFRNYVAKKLKLSLSRAYQLLAAARVFERCEAQGLPMPKNESQVRLRGQGKKSSPASATALPAPSMAAPAAEEGPLSSFIECRPGVVIRIEELLAELRQLHASHACRGNLDKLLAEYRATVLGPIFNQTLRG